MHYDMLFIHPSAHTSSPQFIIMPMGVFSMMNELKDYSVKAVNVGLEMCLNKNFDATQFLNQYEFDYVGIDLHWHEHAFTALETARLCKEINPHCTVIVGGFTASHFATEILEFSPYVDVIIRGEGEEALPQIVGNKDLSQIPNLVYRDNHGTRQTPARPVSLDTLTFTCMTIMEHWEEYLKCSINAYTKTRFWYDFWLCTGRGCVYNCSYCGGASAAQRRLCGREGMTFRSVDAVTKDLTALRDLGVHVVCPSHDMSLAGEKYWSRLFASMKEEGIFMGMYLEVWQLPDKSFIEELARTCDPRFTTVAVTLLSGSETVRQKNGKYFSNEDFYKCAELLEEYTIHHVPYFATGLPFETVDTFEETLKMTETLLSDFNPSSIFCTPLRLDPGSPMAENPEEYGITPHYRTFADYYERCKKRSENVQHDFIGYHTQFLDERMIMELQHRWEVKMGKNLMAFNPPPLHFM